jgi:hypothetical protein
LYRVDSRDYGPVPKELLIGRIKYKIGFCSIKEVAKAAPVDPFESVFQLIPDEKVEQKEVKREKAISTTPKPDLTVVEDTQRSQEISRYREGGLANISSSTDFNRIFATVTVNGANMHNINQMSQSVCARAVDAEVVPTSLTTSTAAESTEV